jgi:hypothetical protein
VYKRRVIEELKYKLVNVNLYSCNHHTRSWQTKQHIFKEFVLSSIT